MIKFLRLHRLPLRVSLLFSTGLLTASAVLLYSHAEAVRDMREIGLPAALALSQIEERAAIIKEQTEVAQLHAALRGGSAQEMLNVYAIPSRDNIDTILKTLDLFLSSLKGDRMIESISDLQAGGKMQIEEGLSALPVNFEATMTQDGLDRFLSLINLSGLLTISDALGSMHIDRLLALTERENPASVNALEKFLATDLLRYAQDPQSYEQELQKSFSSDYARQTLHAVMNNPEIRAARDLLFMLSADLRAQHLWPLRLFTVEKVAARTISDGVVHAAITVRAYVRD
jgi:hypothetical protein